MAAKEPKRGLAVGRAAPRRAPRTTFGAASNPADFPASYTCVWIASASAPEGSACSRAARSCRAACSRGSGERKRFPGAHEVFVVVQRIVGHAVQQRLGLRCRAGAVALDEAPKGRPVGSIGGGDEVEQQAEAHRRRARRLAAVDVPHGVVDPLFRRLLREGVQALDVFVRRLGDHVEMQPLGRLGRLKQVVGQALGRAVAQPVVHAEAVALGLG